MSQIIKIKREHIFETLGRFPHEVLLQDYIVENKVCGSKLTLSLKIGKRRKLITGKLYVEPESCRYSGLHYNFYFTPNNPEKFNKLLNS